MDMLFAMFLGYFIGSATVLFTFYVLQPKEVYDDIDDTPQDMDIKPSAEEKRWLEEMSALIAYDGKGGEMSGDKDNS